MSIPKTTYDQRYALKDLMDRGGAVMTSDWTTGAGRHTRSRTIPPFCERIFREESARYPARIKRVFAQHPRCQAVVAITDMRTARRAVKFRIQGAPLRKSLNVILAKKSLSPEDMRAAMSTFDALQDH
jgi:hypothetical protein